MHALHLLDALLAELTEFSVTLVVLSSTQTFSSKVFSNLEDPP
jgi:hypothetical protein